MNSENQIKSFTTKELHLVTALVCYGYKPLTLQDNVRDAAVVFWFMPTRKLCNHIVQYWSGNLKVDPLLYWAEYNKVIAVVLAEKEAKAIKCN